MLYESTVFGHKMVFFYIPCGPSIHSCTHYTKKDTSQNHHYILYHGCIQCYTLLISIHSRTTIHHVINLVFACMSQCSMWCLHVFMVFSHRKASLHCQPSVKTLVKGLCTIALYRFVEIRALKSLRYGRSWTAVSNMHSSAFCSQTLLPATFGKLQ